LSLFFRNPGPEEIARFERNCRFDLRGLPDRITRCEIVRAVIPSAHLQRLYDRKIRGFRTISNCATNGRSTLRALMLEQIVQSNAETRDSVPNGFA